MSAENVKAETIKMIERVIQVAVNVLRALLAVSFLVAIIGIFNTLILSIIERKREQGILRAVGFSQKQIYAMINYEAIVMSLYGAIVGIMTGLFLAWMLIRAITISAEADSSQMGEQPIHIITNVPVFELFGYCLLAIVVALVASILPAIQASRANIVESINKD